MRVAYPRSMAHVTRSVLRSLAVSTLALRRGILGAAVLVVGVSTAEAATLVWHWNGLVTGHVISFCSTEPDCGPRLSSVVPVGTPIDVFLTIDPDQRGTGPSGPCYRGAAATSLQVLGRTYSGTAHVWDEAFGFGPGVCVPGYDVIEIVAPSWGFGGPELADGWVPFISFFDSFFPGFWWDGDLTHVQPATISSQFPKFFKPGQSSPQRFTATLHAVPTDMHTAPEPTTWVLFGTGLAAAAWRRRRS
jgi:hypothetical protein